MCLRITPLYPQAAAAPRLTDPELRCETLSEDTRWESGCRGNFLVGLEGTSGIKAGCSRVKKKKHRFKAFRMRSLKAEMSPTA